MILAPATAEDADALAKAHARSFTPPWSAEDIAALLAAPGGYAMLVKDAGDAAPVLGFLLARAIAGEAEILTLAVDPSHRRQGLARALLEASVAAAVSAGAEAMFLEVAADNAAAVGLYQSAGFERVGSRRGYYARPGAAAVDALVLRRALNRRGG
jgi:ribosomal-protein-alanine N-acetyltransferase